MVATIRAAFVTWPTHNELLRDRVASLSADQLAIAPGPGRWPLWASVGHLACQRVFWLCDFAGEPGADETPFTEAGTNCPGDDDLEHVWGPADLAEALDTTFRVVERCLDCGPSTGCPRRSPSGTGVTREAPCCNGSSPTTSPTSPS
jgi:hypothetical protein